jgi:mannosyltransferase
VGVLAGGAVLARLGREAVERRALGALVLLAGVALLSAWLAARLEPMWATRYLAIVVGPLLLLGSALAARAGRLGLVAAAGVAAFWATDLAPAEKSNVPELARAVATGLEHGDLVVATQPELVPLLAYYLPAGLEYATPLGRVRDPFVVDWRDGVARLTAAAPERTFVPVLDRLPAGARLLLVRPLDDAELRWPTPWLRLVRLRSAQWRAATESDRRLRLVAALPPTERAARTVLHAALYRKAA